MENKWVEELGKFLLDVGKYVLTAVVISSFLSERTTWQWLIVAIVFTLLMMVVGLMLIATANQKTTSKKSNRLSK